MIHGIDGTGNSVWNIPGVKVVDGGRNVFLFIIGPVVTFAGGGVPMIVGAVVIGLGISIIVEFKVVVVYSVVVAIPFNEYPIKDII